MGESVKTQVVIYAQASLYRAAWGALLAGQPDVVVAGLVAERVQFAALRSLKQPAVALLDFASPLPDLIRHCVASHPALNLLVLVPSYDLAIILPLLQAGAIGCLSRDQPAGDLMRALIAAGRGELVLPPAIAARALAALARAEQGAPKSLAEPLTERELEVLCLLASGLTNKDIAQSLILSVRTVEAHLRSIFVKIDARSRTEAALWAVKHGYMPEA